MYTSLFNKYSDYFDEVTIGIISTARKISSILSFTKGDEMSYDEYMEHMSIFNVDPSLYDPRLILSTDSNKVIYEGTITGPTAEGTIPFGIKLDCNSITDSIVNFALKITGSTGGLIQYASLQYSTNQDSGDKVRVTYSYDNESVKFPSISGKLYSFDEVLSQLDPAADLYNFFSAAMKACRSGSASLQQVVQLIDTSGRGFTPIVQRFIDLMTATVGSSEEINVSSWIQMIQFYMSQLANPEITQDGEVSFTEDDEFTPILWRQVLATVVTTIGQVIAAIPNIVTNIIGTVVSITGGVWQSVLNMTGQTADIHVNSNCPNTIIKFPLTQVTSNSSQLCYYTQTMRERLVTVDSPFVTRVLWRNGTTAEVSCEVLPKLVYDQQGLIDAYDRCFKITLSSNFDNATWIGNGAPIIRHDSFYSQFIEPLEKDPFTGVNSFLSNFNDSRSLVLLKFIAAHILFDAAVSNLTTFVGQNRTRYLTQRDLEETFDATPDAINSFSNVLGLLISSICSATTVSGVMSALEDLRSYVRGENPLSEYFYRGSFFMDDLSILYGGYPEDFDSMLSSVSAGGASVNNKFFITLPTYDAQLTMLATLGLAVVAAAATVAVTAGVIAVKRRLQAHAIAKRNKINSMYEDVEDLSAKYNSGEISFREYYNGSKGYLREVRWYNRFAGFTGLSKIDPVAPGFVNYSSFQGASNPFNSTFSLDPVIKLIAD